MPSVDLSNLTITEDGDWKPIEYDYESRYVFKCEYSKSGRAKCRRCGNLIAKATVRIATPIKWRGGGYGVISSWQHLKCTRVDNPKKFAASKLVFGLPSLKAADKKAVLAELKKAGQPPHLKAIDPNDPNFIRDRELPEVPAPCLLNAELLPYQKEGLGWMLNQELSHYRGGILADEMGMGKTIQVSGYGWQCVRLIEDSRVVAVVGRVLVLALFTYAAVVFSCVLPALLLLPHAVSYTHLTLPTIYSV